MFHKSISFIFLPLVYGGYVTDLFPAGVRGANFYFCGDSFSNR